jgi:hypothetical protein
MDPVALKDLFCSTNSVGKKEGTTLRLITNSDWNASQENMESRTERPGKDDSQIKIPLL